MLRMTSMNEANLILAFKRLAPPLPPDVDAHVVGVQPPGVPIWRISTAFFENKTFQMSQSLTSKNQAGGRGGGGGQRERDWISVYITQHLLNPESSESSSVAIITPPKPSQIQLG